jgi:hypothetical protein
VLSLKHPARNFINYLISRRIYDTKTLVETLNRMGLQVPIDQEGIEGFILQLRPVRQAMVFPADWNPTARKPNALTEAFLKRWAISSAWRNDPAFNTAVDLLCDAQIRQTLQLMLLGPLSPITIADRIAKRFDLPPSVMNAATVKIYGHYFWDIGAMTGAEWKEYLQMYYPAESFDYVCVLHAPRSRTGAMYTLAVADKDAELMDPAERYRLVSAAGFKRFMEHVFSGERSVGQTYAAFAALNIMRTGDDELSKYQGASTDLIEHLERMETVYDTKKPLSIADTGYIRPILNTTAEEVEESNDNAE